MGQIDEVEPIIDELEDRCDTCSLYSDSDKSIRDMVCPKCSSPLDWSSYDFDLALVGSNNSNKQEEQMFRKWPIGRCCNCDSVIALVPTLIVYNANHDIYYTGDEFKLP